MAILEETSLLTTVAYIDLNPVAAGVALRPEDSRHTSLRARVEQCHAEGTAHTLRDDLSTPSGTPAQEAGGWLLPIDDRRADGSARAGLVPGVTLSCDLRPVDWISRLLRAAKASVPASVAPIFERLRAAPTEWGAAVSALFARSQRTGCHFGRAARLASESTPPGTARRSPRRLTQARPPRPVNTLRSRQGST